MKNTAKELRQLSDSDLSKKLGEIEKDRGESTSF